ncbi:hypothetical protein CVIRNUC_010611 [Coccomyxa viridis]|uniref:AMP-dependent synthetase/ligase domain-containing protein n=1 Tax=Coccomyxa viridis TaxID=1274662 RepID=A0AAV1IKN7_9CHLO|nr:hypothetical protein CVIRNUC_010611 [Coccomyxa viridis]
MTRKAENLLCEVAPATLADGKDKPACGPTCRNIVAKEEFPPLDGITTLYELFKRSASRYPNNPCLGTRKHVNRKAGPYEWFIYEETEALVLDTASAMTKVGVSAHERCSIYGGNCAQWMIATQPRACNQQSIYFVPVYDSLGENAVEYIIDHSESSILFVFKE